MKNLIKSALLTLIALAFAGCSMDSGFLGGVDFDGGVTAGAGSEGEGGGNGDHSGILTAGEWNDLAHWDFWLNLVGDNNYYTYMEKWGFFPIRRVAVKVGAEGDVPCADVEVKLLKGENVIWTARTDNKGKASLWENLYTGEDVDPEAEYSVSIGGAVQQTAPVFSTREDFVENEYTMESYTAAAAAAEVAFIVDATGSMSDEITFLKSDLLHVLESAEDNIDRKISTAALFYRDKGDAYVTKVSKFSTLATTINFIKKQDANGGGDYPEAVHTALEVALGNLEWGKTANRRLAFIILDAPAHHDHDGVIASLQASIKSFAEKGIRIIPVLCSSGDKSTEMMSRFFAVATGGTYTFLTDDSGVSAGEHIEPSVGEYEVELLKDLLERLIVEYCG